MSNFFKDALNRLFDSDRPSSANNPTTLDLSISRLEDEERHKQRVLDQQQLQVQRELNLHRNQYLQRRQDIENQLNRQANQDPRVHKAISSYMHAFSGQSIYGIHLGRITHKRGDYGISLAIAVKYHLNTGLKAGDYITCQEKWTQHELVRGNPRASDAAESTWRERVISDDSYESLTRDILRPRQIAVPMIIDCLKSAQAELLNEEFIAQKIYSKIH